MKRCMIVAHPDDETLFGGGIIIRYPGDWTIICCSIPRVDPIRAEKFHEACKVLGAESEVFQQTEALINDPMPWLEEIDLSLYDHIVTHNEAGEYGHPQHRLVHRYVARKYGKKKLTFFGYRRGGRGKHEIQLTEFEAAKKLRALKCYDHELPYDGRIIPKWEALIERYIKNGDLNMDVETYDGSPI